MKTPILALIVGVAIAAANPAGAQMATLKGPLSALSFLLGDWRSDLGDWRSDGGKVADTGGTSKGTSHFTAAADGWVLLGQEHTDTFDKHGKATGSFSEVMLIYAENGKLRADYGDGEGHVIHYTSTETDPGRLVTFIAPPIADAPNFELTYTLKHGALAVDLGTRLPAGGDLRGIAAGTLKRVR